MSDVRLCPSCTTRRMGAFRYCLGCRFDFDSLGADVRGPDRTAEPSWPDPDEARAAIRTPGFGASPLIEPLRGRRQGGPASIRWMTNAVASIGIVALIGVAFQSTGFIPLDAARQPTEPRTVVTLEPGPPMAPTDGTAGPPGTTGPGRTAGPPAANPTSRPALPAPRVVATAVPVTATASTLHGSAGTTTWSAVEFDDVTEAKLTWSATSDQGSGCALRWTLERPNGKAVKGQVKVKGKAKARAERVVKVKHGKGSLKVNTDCDSWSLVLAGTKRGGG